MTFEVEIKVQLKQNELDLFENYLKDEKYLGENLQEDSYFESIPASFAKTDQALRVRSESNTNDTKENTIEITYKGPKLNKNTKTRKEINLKISKSSRREVIDFFENIGFTNTQAHVEKRRKLWKLDNGIVLSLDDVKNLGKFVELEAILEDKDKIEEKERELWNLLAKITNDTNIKERSIIKSYLELVLEKMAN